MSSSTAEARDEAIREAKRYVRDIVQNDWSFEFSAKPGAPPPVYPANPEPTGVLEWRHREYDTSGSELEPQFSPVGSPGLDEFNDGDSGALLEEGARQNERRRKRRRQMEEEMSWNEGLRTWVERRDAWSGALSRQKVRDWEERQRAVVVEEDEDEDEDAGSSDARDSPDADDEHVLASSSSDPSASASRDAGDVLNLATKTEALKIDGNGEDEKATTPASQPQHDPPNGEQHTADAIPDIPVLPQPLSSSSAIPATSPYTSSASSRSPSSPPTATFHDPMIPVVPSLIATSNPIRASITPAMYGSIYSKVVIQGLTPTVPINLADMTKAMVQGWKSDGQWPPKPQNLVLTNDAIVRPSNTSATKHPDTPAIPASAADKDKNAPSSPESKRKSGIASTVRKVLHFSGFHPHPFHRRGSSSQHQSPPEDLAITGAGATDALPASGTGTGNGTGNHEHGEK
ncbi:hypothetical protein BDV06DRAFT_45806 [Aspergillus oleicola]